MNDKLLPNEMYTIVKNNGKNEKNYNSNDEVNGSPKWVEKFVVTSLINITRTSDEEDSNNLPSHKQMCYVEIPRNPTTNKYYFRKVMKYWLTWTKSMESW
jgi:hypothetical protein